MTSEEQDIYDAGFEEGRDTGYEAGYSEGKTIAFDEALRSVISAIENLM